MSKYSEFAVTIDEKVSHLTHYLIRIYESRDSWAREACMHSPISKLASSNVRVLEALDCGEPVNMVYENVAVRQRSSGTPIQRKALSATGSTSTAIL